METNISYANLFELFNQAISHNLKYPKLRLQLGTETVVVKLAGDKSRYTGDIMLTNDAGYGALNNRYFGRIEKNGGLIAGRDLTPAVESFIQTLAADPIGVCAANGKLTGNCVFCTKPLTDANSLAVGYGPVCAKKFSLPWNAAKQSRKSRSIAAQLLTGPTQNFLHEGLDNAKESACDEAMELDRSGRTKAQADQQEVNLVNAGMDV